MLTFLKPGTGAAASAGTKKLVSEILRSQHSVENYEKGEVREVDDGVVDLDFDDSVVHMRVSGGSKTRNLMGYAMKKLKEPEVKQITWNGSGRAVTKAISCAEIMKRKVKGLHQITKIRFKRIEEYWEPKTEGLERLKVNRDIPAVTILLSKEPLDESIPGYQGSGSFDVFWKKSLLTGKKKLDQSSDAKAAKKKFDGSSDVKASKKARSDIPAHAAAKGGSAKKQKQQDREGQDCDSQKNKFWAGKHRQSQGGRNVKQVSTDSSETGYSVSKEQKGVKQKNEEKNMPKSPKTDTRMDVDK